MGVHPSAANSANRSSLCLPGVEEGSLLKLNKSIYGTNDAARAWYKALRYGTNSICDVWAFINNVQLQPNEGLLANSRGTTWLELYIWYRLNGGHKPVPDNACKARSASSLKVQLRTFRQLIELSLARGHPDDDTRRIFRPILGDRGDRLKHVAVLGQFAAIDATLRIDKDARVELKIETSNDRFLPRYILCAI